jgi:hypothetical protein
LVVACLLLGEALPATDAAVATAVVGATLGIVTTNLPGPIPDLAAAWQAHPAGIHETEWVRYRFPPTIAES